MIFLCKSKYVGAIRAARKVICVALLALLPILIYCQVQQKPDTILLAEAIGFAEKKEYKKAIEKANLAAAGFIRNANWLKLLDCQDMLFNIEFQEIYPTTLLPNIETIHSNIPDHLQLEKAISSYNLGYIEERSGNLLKALTYYREAIPLFKSRGELEYLAMAYGDAAPIFTQFGDYSRASKFLNVSAELMLQINDTLGYSYNIFNLAENAFYNDEFEKSEKLYRKYQVLEPEVKEEIYIPLCEIKTAKMELDSARIYFDLAKKWVDNGGNQSFDLNRLLADILCAEGNLEEAIIELSKIETEVDEFDNLRDKGKYFWKIADLYSRNNDWDKAQFYFNKSLQSFSNFEISIDSISKLKQKSYLFYEIWLGDILVGLAQLYKEKYSTDKEEKLLLKSKECLDLALESLDYKRSVFEDVESSLSLNKKSKALYEKAINIYLSWFEESGDESDLDEAFQLTQRHNAFVLRQQINTRTKLDRYEVSDTLKREYLDLKLHATEESFKVGARYTTEGFEQLKKTESKLDSIEEILVLNYPQIAKSGNDFEVSTIEHIQRILNKDRAIIKYFEGVENVYSFLITKDDVQYFVHPNVDEIRQDIQLVRSVLSDFNYEKPKLDSIEKKYLDVAFRLGKSIVGKEMASLPKIIKKITIVPSGSLTQIPFEALIIDKKNSWNEPNQFLIHEYAISYNYFCKALTSPAINKELEKVLSYGLEYDVYTLNASKKISNDSISNQIIEKFRSEEMGHLYFADDEANEVAEMFDGISFVNADATKKNFLSNVLDYDIIHLSAHSFVDFQYPSNSAIIFTKPDSLTDNLLQVKDVDRLMLDGQLFTLSACNTFFGKNNEGEGLSSIARSFIQSGAGSVIGSFWSVPDEISKSFMVHFYSKLKQGLSKDEALRATKIDFMTDDNLSSPLYRSPTYWSAWVIYGDTQSIYKSYDDLVYFGIGLLCFGILLWMKFSL